MKKHDTVSPAMDLPVIGSIATMPSRVGTFSKMLPGVLSQVDKLFVFLDGFDETPPELRNLDKCHVTLLSKAEGLHASSRFLAPHLFDAAAVVVLFDDDILYPPDYVSQIRQALSQYGRKAIVGFHASIFMPPHNSYANNRRAYHFARGLPNDSGAHVLGAGTAAFLSSRFRPDPTSWRLHHMDDLYLAGEAIKANLNLIALKREANWLKPLAENQEDSIWRQAKRDDSVHSQFMRDLLVQYMQQTWNHYWWQRQ